MTDDHHITVNQTIKKESDDDFKTFYHKKVVVIKPPHEESQDPSVTPQYPVVDEVCLINFMFILIIWVNTRAPDWLF